MKCYRCKQNKEEKEFPPGEKRCLQCREYCLQYYKEHKQESIERALKHQKIKGRKKINAYKRELSRKNPAGTMLWQVKTRAKKKGIPFNLTHEDIVIPKLCPILNIPLKINDGHSGFDSPTLDRFVPKLGYVKGNVQVISHRANTIKNDATLEELEKIINWMKSKCYQRD